MHRIVSIAFIMFLSLSITAESFAKGGFSSGGSRGFSSGSSRSFSSGTSRSYSAPRSTTTITRNTTINRSYGGGGYGGYYHPMMMYPGFGMGYGYSNGVVEGLIIGSLMHPQGTTVYSGGGYSGNALLYPDGRVVDQNGYQVGTYANGQFSAVQGGQMVAQPAPANPQAQAVVVTESGPSWLAILGEAIVGLLGLIMAWIILGWLFGLCSVWNDSETITETITTTYDDERPIAGTLKRKQENGQFYVIDPVDKTKNWLNDKDDMYEDAADKLWRLR